MKVKNKNICDWISLLCSCFLIITSYGQECAHKIDGDIEASSGYKEGIRWFPSKTQQSMRKIQDFFEINVNYILAEDYDGICHEFNSRNGLKNATVTIGEDFLEKYKNDPLFIEILLAHEAGHTLQYLYKDDAESFLGTLYGGNGILKGKNKELQADVIAGFYLYSEIRRRYDKASSKQEKNDIDAQVEKSVGKFEAIADYQFTHASHHGRFKERTQALSSGVNLAMYGFDSVRIYKNDFQGIYYTSFGIVRKWKSTHRAGGFKW